MAYARAVTDNTVTGAGTAFLGRRAELAALRSDLDRAGLDTLAGRPVPRARVLLVAGRPGSGRTTLAEEFAGEVLASGAYPDGLLRARLTEPGGADVPAEDTARALLTALEAPVPPGADDEELTSALRAELRERRCVLLVDDAPSAEQLDELVPDSRDCLVLAVARGPLTGLPGVRPCVVGGLEPAAALELLAQGAGDVRITVDPTAAERLAEACAHLPAALRLVAGWLAAHPEATVAEAVRRMTEPAPPGWEPLGADGGPAAAADPEEQPLRRAFALAAGSLPAPAARMLRLLALAPAGLADAHVAGALAGCPVGTARATLAALAQLGLLRPAGPPHEERYQVPGCLLPLLREALAAGERTSETQLARARLLERTVRQLAACQAVTQPPGSPARTWLASLPGPMRFESASEAADWLDVRLPALFSAARAAVAGGDLDTLARRLVTAFGEALTAHRGPQAAAPFLYRLHELALRVAERQGLAREAAASQLFLADADARCGRHTVALERYRQALRHARSGPGAADEETAGRALVALGHTYAALGDWQRSADWYGRALAQCQASGDLAACALLHGRIGETLARAGQWQEALRSWRAAAAEHRRRGDPASQARALAEAAGVQERAGRVEEALRTAREALRRAQRAGDPSAEAAVRLRLASASERLGQPQAARAHRAEAARLLARVRPVAEPPVASRDDTLETQAQSRNDLL